MAAKAMNSSMIHIRPYYLSGETKRRGTFIIGTVTGDLHDIGKEPGCHDDRRRRMGGN
ncbi:MAG: hypothetical protein MZV63_52380 [Marinilabiliales bacterium]|nr:hypothetical protein [Marinilabiliales bacterium]